MEILSDTVMAEPIDQLHALLATYGLVINHIWHGGPLYPRRLREQTIRRTIEVLDASRSFDARELVFDPFEDRGRISAEDARAQNLGLERIGREARDRGIALYVHNHESPMRNNAGEWLGVLEGTDPALVSMCLDLDWTWRAQADPLALLHRAGDAGRLGAVHLRTQHRRVTDQTMEDGGDIDFGKVADYVKAIGFSGPLVEETEIMIETEVTRPVRENKRIAREWCERVFEVSAAL